jgi:hypothetical protein
VKNGMTGWFGGHVKPTLTIMVALRMLIKQNLYNLSCEALTTLLKFDASISPQDRVDGGTP